MEAVAKGFERHVVDDLVDKSILQQEFGFFKRDAPLTHVEEGRIIELANSRAMRALHIIRIDFEHGLGVHTGLLRGSEVLIGHLRGGFLGTMLYQDLSSKSTCSLIVEHIFVEFV